MIPNYLPLDLLIQTKQALSERALSHLLKISRTLLRQLKSPFLGNIGLHSIERLAQYYDRKVEILVSPANVLAEYSTIATALKVERDGFESWKVHFFDFVDEFRRSLDVRLMLLPSHEKFEPRLKALLASIVRELCTEPQISAPAWALKQYFLPQPWFIAEIESLKASTILEAPLAYRSNNIFVQSNFLSRA